MPTNDTLAADEHLEVPGDDDLRCTVTTRGVLLSKTRIAVVRLSADPYRPATAGLCAQAAAGAQLWPKTVPPLLVLAARDAE